MEATDAGGSRKRRLNTYGRMLRRDRIFEQLRQGFAYDEIAREEGVSPERIRQIVSETLQKRSVDTAADHAKLQLARLERVMVLAAEALGRGELKAGPLYLKTIDRLDRYQKAAGVIQRDDDEIRERLLAKINRLAERFGADKIPAENKGILAEREGRRQNLAEEGAASPPPAEATENYFAGVDR